MKIIQQQVRQLLKAIASPHGTVVSTDDPRLLQLQLPKQAKLIDLSEPLAYRIPTENSSSELWIIKKEENNNAS